MPTARPAIAIDPRRFGRRMCALHRETRPADSLADDLRLFGVTFAAGFLFVSVLIA